jgi:class 3 adenylate cyclase
VPVESRKTVTALFCDVSGSTELADRLDPEALRTVMERYFARVSDVLASHGGTVEKYIGDAVVAVFGVPVAHEDDALRSCRSALEVLSAVAELKKEISAAYGVGFAARIGIETGEVLVGDPSRGSTFASGVAVNTAARLEQAASPGECLVGPACHRLVRDRVITQARPGLALKGVAEPVDAFLLLDAADARAEVDLLRTPYVGRTRELGLLRQAFDRAAGDRTVQLATVLGVAGMGKSRLTAEFLGSLDEQVTVLRGRCVSYGEGLTYWPLVEVVRQAVGLTGAEPEQYARDALRRLLDAAPDAAEVTGRIAPVAGLGGEPGAPEDTAWAVRRLLEQLARDRPVVLVIDDLHWAEPGLVGLVEDVCQWLLDAPVLVLVLARPEFLDDHPQWGGGRTNAVAALLEPLTGDDVETLVAGVLGGALPAHALGRVSELAGGNPLYLEHLLAMLVEDGVLVADGDGWVLRSAAEQIQVPPSITALIAARLDRLPSEERSVLGQASVMGQVFYRNALTQLSSADGIGRHVSALVRKGLVRPVTSDMPGQDALRFGHVLVRDAAYAMLPKAVRADLHERFARWLDKVGEGQAVDDFVGAHLEAAYLARAELGALDKVARDLGIEASRRLETAGRQLLFVDDGAATALLERADHLRDDQTPERWALQLDLVTTWQRNAARLRDAERLVEGLREAADAADDRAWGMRARLLAAMIQQHKSAEGSTKALLSLAAEARDYFHEHRDHHGMSLAHMALVDGSWMTYDVSAASRHLSLAASHAESAGRFREAAIWRASKVSSLIVGDCTAERGLQESREILASTEGLQYRSMGMAVVGLFAALLGREREGAQAWALADRLAREVPSSLAALGVAFHRGDAMLAMGNWASAAHLMTRVSAHFAESESWSMLSTVAARRAIALLHTREVDAARAEVTVALQHAAEVDVATQAPARAVQSWLAAIDGEESSAHQYAEEATLLLPDEALLDRALVQAACAEAMLVLGDRDQADRHRHAAIELHERKGNLVGVAHHRARLADVGG